MPYYETVFILRQDISATQVETIADSMAEVLTSDSGKISRREYWGLKTMAYRMKKNRKGHYVLFNYDAPIESVREMERLMGLHEDVLRVLTLRTDDLPEEPSVVMANRNDRGGRYGRDRSDRPRVEKKPEPRVEQKPEAAAPVAEKAAPAAEQGETP
jgi:small subunit ribosomal protein S6